MADVKLTETGDGCDGRDVSIRQTMSRMNFQPTRRCSLDRCLQLTEDRLSFRRRFGVGISTRPQFNGVKPALFRRGDHFAEGKHALDEIPLDRLIGPGVVIDVREACGVDRDHLVTVDEIRLWEAQHGRLPAEAIVLLRTGFGRHWPDRTRYMGTDARGPEAVADLHFPGLHPDTASWLIAERSIGAVGLDTPSIDHGPSKDFAAHCVLFAENVPAFENVANLHELPPRDFTVVALPMKIRGGSGGPLRIVALIDD